MKGNDLQTLEDCKRAFLEAPANIDQKNLVPVLIELAHAIGRREAFQDAAESSRKLLESFTARFAGKAAAHYDPIQQKADEQLLKMPTPTKKQQ